MTVDVFEGALAKMDRAKEHFETFEFERERFLDEYPYRIGMEHDLVTGWHTAVFVIEQEPPPLLSVLLGEIAYECLSALNHLTWELASRKLGRKRIVERKYAIQFPVCRTPQHFAAVPLIKHRLVSKPAAAALAALQPYDGRLGLKVASGHPAVLIKAIADADKHRILAGSYAQVHFGDIEWTWDRSLDLGAVEQDVYPLPRPLVHGAKLGRIRFETNSLKSKVHVDRQPAVDLLFTTDRASIRQRHIKSLAWWLEFVALFGLAHLFDQDHWVDPPTPTELLELESHVRP